MLTPCPFDCGQTVDHLEMAAHLRHCGAITLPAQPEITSPSICPDCGGDCDRILAGMRQALGLRIYPRGLEDTGHGVHT